MKPNKYKLTHSRFIKAEKRLNEIYKLQRQAPKVPITPYQNGWIVTIVLRDDYLRSDKGAIVAPLLESLVSDIVVKNPKYISQIRKKPSLYDARRVLNTNKYFYHSPYIRPINQELYEKLSQQEQKYFSLDWFESQKDRWGGKRNSYYLDIPQHYLVVKITKRIITHAKEIDTLLLQEEAELKKILAPYWRKCSHSGGDYYWEELAEIKKKKKGAQLPIRKLLELE